MYAFRNGADAVYLGLPRYSARKAARNLTMDELSRLRTLADREGKRIYAAVNTVIRDEELEDALSVLYDLSLLPVDAVIVQDYGLLSLVRKHFPGLPIHASTQMAVHNAAGVNALARAGVSRVILARELTLEEIRAIRASCPETELEVFIHGALCYGVSGLCLASGMLLGRSGNRGECAQICRGRFASRYGEGSWLSANDLSLEEEVLALQDAGVVSFKIEGRMKPPEYAGAAASYYRAVLDRLPDEAKRERLHGLRTVFSRTPTTAFLRTSKGERLIGSEYTGHRGIPAGTVIASGGGSIRVRLTEPLSVRDGILYFTSAGPVKAAVRQLDADGTHLFDAAAGSIVRIPADDPLPPPGAVLYKISSHDQTWPEIPSASERPKKFRFPVDVELTEDSIRLTARLPVPSGLQVPDESVEPGAVDIIPVHNENPRPDGGRDASSVGQDGPAIFGTYTVRVPVRPERSRSGKSFPGLLAEALSASGDAPGTAELERFTNLTGLEENRIFIPPSVLKRICRELYAGLQPELQRHRTAIVRIMLSRAGIPVAPDAACSAVPSRDMIVPTNERPVPFVTSFEPLSPAQLASIDGTVYLPLAPVVFDQERYFRELERFLDAHPALVFALGLSNAAHLGRVPELARRGNVRFFIDYGLYCANRASYAFFSRTVPRLLFAYPWIEERDTGGASVFEAFRPPLFISRVCPRRHAFGETCASCRRGTPEGDASQPLALEQNGKNFEIATRDCVTYIFGSRYAVRPARPEDRAST